MGCGGSSQPRYEMSKSEKSLKAALLIQRWYRRYQARLEARRRCTWNIFQSIEYSGEQDQLKLYNFFNDMLTSVEDSPKASFLSENGISEEEENPQIIRDDKLDKLDVSKILVEPTYQGVQLTFPLTAQQLQDMVASLKEDQPIHARYCIQILLEARKLLREKPNVNQATTALAKQITVCGDLHGKLDDLFIIFYKNGLPSKENPYVFNGDFVDRGPHSVEVAMLLFAFFLVYPNEVYLNRGNHEDHIMNLRYGFIREVQMKYGKPNCKQQAQWLIPLFKDVFSLLPLATVIDGKILVAHGGISDKTDLTLLTNLDRRKYKSVLKPPLKDGADEITGDEDDLTDKVNFSEWRQILDVLWSDPKMVDGCQPNLFRGGGSYFGPDISSKVLKKHSLDLLIRSHECKSEGYEYTHNGLVLTVFSASNYYEMGSNRGAYVKLGSDLKPRCIQYMASKSHQKLSMAQRLSIVEESALRDLKEKMATNKTTLKQGFQQFDPNNTGFITLTQWAHVMEEVLELTIPWRTLRNKLIRINDQGMVEYESCMEVELTIGGHEGGPSVTEVLYRNKNSLETIFRAMDKDHSGTITMDEFEEACSLLSKHVGSDISKESVRDMARCIDINKDGYIDFNEFLEAFRLVDTQVNSAELDSNKSKADLKMDSNGTNDMETGTVI
ncbi:serine/threonine-protein phosphatase with EF-hands 2-like [Patiria miniata]|uniref:Serine/threonine-protein phosphatase with EF-hands n=1 Tax=Patiria miniata TaxID=46514 RepID=A0A913ZVM9_PATMI|nr:serine/threonine-protein phosphatase with EF-hands 2-like [Patiria miniata]XP_038055331.1 serine/threonine-protein phosphatase with EF-hands 2-like [Patiria miniata]